MAVSQTSTNLTKLILAADFPTTKELPNVCKCDVIALKTK